MPRQPPSASRSKQQCWVGGCLPPDPTLSRHRPHHHNHGPAHPRRPAQGTAGATLSARGGGRVPDHCEGVFRAGCGMGRACPQRRPRLHSPWLRRQRRAEHTVIFLCLRDNLLSAPAERGLGVQGLVQRRQRGRGAEGSGQWCRSPWQQCCGDPVPVGERCCGAEWERGGQCRGRGLPGPPGAGMGMGMGRGTGTDPAQRCGAGGPHGRCRHCGLLTW